MVDHNPDPTPRAASGQAPADGERVAKALARAGVASRREVERLIAAGRVALNGQVLDTPAVKVGPDDLLTVDGALVGEREPTRVWRYHKPTGLVTTHRDPKGRPTVFEHLPEGLPRVISVGRLDLNSEGLLLLTNDGGLARALELPANGLVRRYRARARGHTTQARLDELQQGLTVEGVHYGPIEAHLDKAKEGAMGANLWITLTLTEGKNREVRKVLEALGLTVNRLIRLSYGPFLLGTLEVGEVEEVGPRVIREQLAAHIAPDSLPTATRTAPAPVAAARPEARPEQRRAGRGEGRREDGRREETRRETGAETSSAKGGRRDGRPGRFAAPANPEPAQRAGPTILRGTVPPRRGAKPAVAAAPVTKPEAPPKAEYKPGWAKPKKRPSRSPPKPGRAAGSAADRRSTGANAAGSKPSATRAGRDAAAAPPKGPPKGGSKPRR